MKQRKPYHHGHLRQALLTAAIRLIAEAGPTAFTLRAVARRAGVSHNAPYRHFRDKDDLMAAVATQGFQELTEAMLDAAGRNSNPLAQLKGAGLAYTAFALRRPEHFTVMFDVAISEGEHSEAAQAGKQAFGTLVTFIRRCQEGKMLPSGDPLRAALLAWSMVHGIAKLAITGRLPYRSRAGVMKFAEFAVDELLAVPERGRRRR